MFKNGFDFHLFTEDVRGKYRFVHSARVTRFLDDLVASATHRVSDFPIDSKLWRAQIGSRIEARPINDAPLGDVVVEENVPYLAERMVPLPHSAHEGRVNPKGIPCLYMASDPDTAMAEVRPWLGVRISLASLRTVRDLKLIDCSVHTDVLVDPEAYFGKTGSENTTKLIWSLVDRSFSSPVVEDPATAEYVPTQIMAEAFKRAGYDGLIYRSRIGSGLNYAVFDLDDAFVESVELYNTETITHTFAKSKF